MNNIVAVKRKYVVLSLSLFIVLQSIEASAFYIQKLANGIEAVNHIKKVDGGALIILVNDNYYYHGKRIYRQNRGAEPLGWTLSGPSMDEAAAQLNRPYYENSGFRSTPRNYIYYDWGW